MLRPPAPCHPSCAAIRVADPQSDVIGRVDRVTPTATNCNIQRPGFRTERRRMNLRLAPPQTRTPLDWSCPLTFSRPQCLIRGFAKRGKTALLGGIKRNQTLILQLFYSSTHRLLSTQTLHSFRGKFSVIRWSSWSTMTTLTSNSARKTRILARQDATRSHGFYWILLACICICKWSRYSTPRVGKVQPTKYLHHQDLCHILCIFI